MNGFSISIFCYKISLLHVVQVKRRPMSALELSSLPLFFRHSQIRYKMSTTPLILALAIPIINDQCTYKPISYPSSPNLLIPTHPSSKFSISTYQLTYPPHIPTRNYPPDPPKYPPAPRNSGNATADAHPHRTPTAHPP